MGIVGDYGDGFPLESYVVEESCSIKGDIGDVAMRFRGNRALRVPRIPIFRLQKQALPASVWAGSTSSALGALGRVAGRPLTTTSGASTDRVVVPAQYARPFDHWPLLSPPNGLPGALCTPNTPRLRSDAQAWSIRCTPKCEGQVVVRLGACGTTPPQNVRSAYDNHISPPAESGRAQQPKQGSWPPSNGQIQSQEHRHISNIPNIPHQERKESRRNQTNA